MLEEIKSVVFFSERPS